MHTPEWFVVYVASWLASAAGQVAVEAYRLHSPAPAPWWVNRVSWFLWLWLLAPFAPALGLVWLIALLRRKSPS
jgi:hypothetical protein